MTEPTTTSPSPEMRTSSTASEEEHEIPPEVKSSVLYAKISSDYLCGHAASILHIARTIKPPTHHSGNPTEWDIDSHGYPITPRTSTPDHHESTNASFQDFETLLDARWTLLRDLKQFQTDSMEWANYLESGYEIEGEGEPVHISCPREAAEIRKAVEKARREVQKALREIVGGNGVGVQVDGGRGEEEGGSEKGRRKGGRWKGCGCLCFATE